MLKITDKSIVFESAGNLLVLELDGKAIPRIAYLGPKGRKRFDFHKDSCRDLLSCFGNLSYQECSFGYIDQENNFSHRFLLKEIRPEEGEVRIPSLPNCKGNREIVRFVYVDLENKMEAVQTLSSFPSSGVFVSSFSFKNISDEALSLNRAFSLELELPGKGYEVISFHGDWGRERTINATKVNQGNFVLSTTCGISSAYVNPFFMLRKGKIHYGFNLLYSGNHKESVSVSPLSSTRVLTGLNDDYFAWELKPGEIFYTPEAIFTCASSLNGVKESLNSFVDQHVLNKKKNPIVFNTWEAVGPKLYKKTWQELARLASESGCDTFVFDDGWYAHREDDKSSLGDFYLNKDKLGGDFAFIKGYLRGFGLDLGIWIEPEMANPNSDLARNHPEFILKTDGVEPLLKRNQYVLDMSNPDCVSYLKKTLSALIEESGCSYVKWDYNRFVSDVASSVHSGYAFFHKLTLGYYELISYLTSQYPDVYFEGCSSGGARFDLGSLAYASAIWTSDNTDPYDRLFIQESTGICYPLSSISNHISESPNQQTGRLFSIKERANVALFGGFGIEMDLRKASEEENAYIKEAVSFYKAHRSVIIEGKNLLLNSPFSKDLKGQISLLGDEGVCLLAALNSHKGAIPLAGLDEKKNYEVAPLGEGQSFFASGAELMSKGLAIAAEGKLATAVYYLKAI